MTECRSVDIPFDHKMCDGKKKVREKRERTKNTRERGSANDKESEREGEKEGGREEENKVHKTARFSNRFPITTINSSSFVFASARAQTVASRRNSTIRTLAVQNI